MSEFNKKKNITLRVFAFALLLCLFLAYAIVGVNAKFRLASDGSVKAEVAEFNISGEFSKLELGEQLYFNFYDADECTDEIPFTVSSDSEVAVRYSVIVTTSATTAKEPWLDLSIGALTPTVSVNSFRGLVTYTFADEELMFFDLQSIDPHEWTLTFSVKDEFIGNSDVLGSDPDLSFNITVRAEQID